MAVQAQAADAITAADIARDIRAITADSLGGRDTPSRGLELTAQYVAAEFQRLGLTPAGDDSTWFQRYDVPGSQYMSRSESQMRFTKPAKREGQGADASVDDLTKFAAGAWLATEMVDYDIWHHSPFATPSAVLVAGRHTVHSVRQADIKDKCVLYVPPAGIDSLTRLHIMDALRLSSVSVTIPTADDSATFARQVQASQPRPLRLVDIYMGGRMGVRAWLAYVWPAAMRKTFLAAGIDVDALRADTVPIVRELPLKCELELARDTTKSLPPTVPNVMAELAGGDPKLKDEYIVYTAHMDNAGPVGGPGDNAAGTAGLLALAKAFSQPGARPKRSVLFIATSGGAKDWWGARYIELHGTQGRKVMASVHLNALDHATDDSVVVDGIGDFAALHSPVWLAMAHPELGVTAVDGGPVDRSFDNHGAFLRRFVPSLFFHRSANRDGQLPKESPSMNENYLARVLRLAFYTGYDMANGEATPQWSEDGRRNLQGMVLNE